MSVSPEEIKKYIERFTDKIYPSKEEFFNALNSKKLIIYHGVDPTGPQLHLGHSTNYLLLRKLQEMGHKIILLIGDFTAQIGDPTEKSSTRKSLTKQEVKENFKTYKDQAGKILDFKSSRNSVCIEFNSKWLAKMNLTDVMKLLSHVTHAQITQRSIFKERIKNNKDLYLHELLYPILQGYDSVAMNVDTEVGGVDQTFNMLMGRDLVKVYNKKNKFVITTPLLENSKTGKKLMSKSEGNFVALNDLHQEMYGKIMSLPDEAIFPCFKLCTEISMPEIEEIEKMPNPKDQKARLAFEIVKMYHGEKEAQKAEEQFNKTFRDKNPDFIKFKYNEREISILDLLLELGLAPSKNKAKRLVLQKAVEIDGEIQEDWQRVIKTKTGMKIQVGKRRFSELI